SISAGVEALPEHADALLCRGIHCHIAGQNSDPTCPGLPLILRQRRRRIGDGTTNQRNELAAPHHRHAPRGQIRQPWYLTSMPSLPGNTRATLSASTTFSTSGTLESVMSLAQAAIRTFRGAFIFRSFEADASVAAQHQGLDRQ